MRELIDGLRLNEDFLYEFGQKATSWGLCVVPEPTKTGVTRNVRCSLLPRSYRKDLVDTAVNVNPLFNKLIDRVSTDVDWLINAHKDVVKSDAFTGRLVDLARSVYKGGKSPHDEIQLYLIRNDFLPTSDDTRILQVEINTISASFGGLIERLSLVHGSNKPMYYPHLPGVLPDNKPCSGYADAIFKAVHSHNKKHHANAIGILFVVEEGEKNIVDQYLVELELVKRGLVVLRRTLSQIHNKASLHSSCSLHVDGIEIALVYFRSAYDPKHYIDESCWKARETIEHSNAVKCPTVLTQLAGTKKVQQLWSVDNGRELKGFGFNETETQKLMSVFAQQFDPSTDSDARQNAIADPEAWVLKPQREGGGHNMYSNDLKKALSDFSTEELSQYVLMERMIPNTTPALVVNGQESTEKGRIVTAVIPEAVAELGVYSYYLPSEGKNNVCGFLVRTKAASEKEGGVNAGYSVLDTLNLV